MKPFLEDRFAPTTTMHGSLADVYGVGLLFVGASGVGKSEAVLDLVERGHRLVADDLVVVSRRGQEVLMGRGSELQGHHMEIRGVGIIDIHQLFGIRAIRLQKRIEVVVQLEVWDADAEYDRTGLDTRTIDILGSPCPRAPCAGAGEEHHWSARWSQNTAQVRGARPPPRSSTSGCRPHGGKSEYLEETMSEPVRGVVLAQRRWRGLVSSVRAIGRGAGGSRRSAKGVRPRVAAGAVDAALSGEGRRSCSTPGDGAAHSHGRVACGARHGIVTG